MKPRCTIRALFEDHQYDRTLSRMGRGKALLTELGDREGSKPVTDIRPTDRPFWNDEELKEALARYPHQAHDCYDPTEEELYDYELRSESLREERPYETDHSLKTPRTGGLPLSTSTSQTTNEST